MELQERFQNQLLFVLRGASQDVKFLREMIQSGGVDINANNDGITTPLQMAAAYGHDEVLALLIANNALIDEPNSLGWTALMQATRNGHVGCMEKLITSGANVLLRTRMGVDTLSLAAASGSCDAMRCIISTCGLNTASLPPLCFAVLANKPKLVHTMLNGFNPNDVLPSSGLTPLMLATMIGNEHMVTLLCSSGSNVVTTNSLGQTAADIATTIHGLYLKEFKCWLGKQCTSTKVHKLRQINTYRNLIEIIKKSDTHLGNTILKEETNIQNSDSNKYFNVSQSCIPASILEQRTCSSTSITDSGTSFYNNRIADELQLVSNSPAYSCIEDISDTRRGFSYSPSTYLSILPEQKQLEIVPEQNVVKGLSECRNSLVTNLLVKNESHYSTPTRKFSPVMVREMQSTLSHSAQGTPKLHQHSYLGLYNNTNITSSPVLKVSPRLQMVGSPGNSARMGPSFRSPSKHIPHKGNGNRSPLAGISRRIF